MDTPDVPLPRSPRREIQGPRPAPLKVRKDSHKIRKPPVAPHPAAAPSQTYQSHAPPRPPVIIYTVSPKIIHANPNEFMSLVQRLTGPNTSCNNYNSNINSETSTSSSTFRLQEYAPGGVISPAARLASIEKIKSPGGRKSQILEDDHLGIVEGIEIERTTQFAGILSPNPNSLPPIPPNFFSPPSDYNPNNPFSFLPEFSPAWQSSGFIMPSPSTTLFSPQINMPSPNTLHLFNTLFDL